MHILLFALFAIGQADEARLRKMLGSDFDRARILTVQGDRVFTVNLKGLKTQALATFPKAKRFRGLDRPWWSLDAREVIVSHGGKAYIMDSDGKNKREAVPGETAYGASFWQDPNTGERCIVYKTVNGKHWFNKHKGVGTTWLYRPKSGKKTKLADFPFDGGLSPDGSHLADAYGGCIMKDLKTGKVHILYRGKQACNATMSPDSTYRLMHLYLPHDYFGIRDKFDKEHWRITKPKDSQEWQTPRFSNHPNFCAATAKYGGEYKIVIIQIDTKEMVVLKDLAGSWRVPQVWLPSAAKKLQSLVKNTNSAGGIESIKARLAKASDYSPIMKELASSSISGAGELLAGIESEGQKALKGAGSHSDPLQARGIYRRLAAQYGSHEIGKKAKSILESKKFKSEISAAPLVERMHALAGKLKKAGEEHIFADTVFFEKNRALLVQMVELGSSIQKKHPGTKGALRAAKLAHSYALPGKTAESGNQILTVLATVEETSRVPTYRLHPIKRQSPMCVIRWMRWCPAITKRKKYSLSIGACVIPDAPWLPSGVPV